MAHTHVRVHAHTCKHTHTLSLLSLSFFPFPTLSSTHTHTPRTLISEIHRSLIEWSFNDFFDTDLGSSTGQSLFQEDRLCNRMDGAVLLRQTSNTKNEEKLPLSRGPLCPITWRSRPRPTEAIVNKKWPGPVGLNYHWVTSPIFCIPRTFLVIRELIYED